MQVTQIIQGVHLASAGPTYCVARLTGELNRLGAQAAVLTLGEPPVEWPSAVPLRRHAGPLPRVAGVSCGMAREIRGLASTPGILHGNGLWRYTNLFPWLFSGAAPARIVFSPHGMLSSWSMRYKAALKAPFWALLQKPALARSHCLHVTAPIEYEDVRRVGLRAPVAVIPYGIDIPQLRPGEPRLKRVVFMSRIDPKKGVDLLLPAWQALAADFSDWELVIAGPLGGTYADSMQALARRLAVPRVRFTGQVLGEDKRALLSGAALFVLPTRSENFGMVVPEALAHGTPVITTDETPWQEIRRRGCGWIIHPERQELEQVLRAAMSRPPEHLRAMGATGRAWMQADYAWGRIAAMMRDTYAWLLHGGVRPGWVVD
jgi:glycosyltransferase involved in cell wall biosynthesis